MPQAVTLPIQPGSWGSLNDYLASFTEPPTSDTAAVTEMSVCTFVPQTLSASGTEQAVWVVPFDCVLTSANLVAMGGAVAASDSTFWSVNVTRFRGLEAYYNNVLASNATSYWPLDEPSGTTATDVVAAANGASTGGVTVNQAPLTGYRASYLFNGTTGWIEVPSSSAVDLADGPFSIECWFKRAGTGVQHIFVHRGGNAYTLFVDSTDTVKFSKAGVTTMCQSTGPYTDTLAHHVVVTHSPGLISLYIDGQDVTLRSGGGYNPATVLADNATVMRIGATVTGTTPMSGNIDNVSLYKRVLTPTEVAAHYAAGLNPGVIATKTTKITNGEAIAQRADWNFDAITFDQALKVLQKGDVVYFTFTRTSTPANLINTLCQVKYQPL